MTNSNDSAAFCSVMAKICIFLFLRRAVTSRRRLSASKSRSLLIADNTTDTNKIQTNFDSNVHIATFDHEPFTNLFKLFLRVLRALVVNQSSSINFRLRKVASSCS
jgi:hypothetical protein